MMRCKKYIVSAWLMDNQGRYGYQMVYETDWLVSAWVMLIVNAHPGTCIRMEVRNY